MPRLRKQTGKLVSEKSYSLFVKNIGASMQHWLHNFAYQTDLNLFHFVVSGLLAFALGALTVGVKSYQAATASPVKTLKEE